LGFGAVEGGKIAGDLVKTRAVMGRGAAVKQAIIDDAMGRMKPVPKAPTPEQITGPGATLTADSVGNISNTPNPANQVVRPPNELPLGRSAPISGTPSEPPVPPVAPQLMLPSPGKQSTLPMSDDAVNIAQRLMNNPPIRSVQGEGVIEQPKGVPASPINIADRLRTTAGPAILPDGTADLKPFTGAKPLGTYTPGIPGETLGVREFKSLEEFDAEVARLKGKLRVGDYSGFVGGKTQLESTLKQMPRIRKIFTGETK
jgi:hypothetical protein